ncbi:MAG: tRNA 2-thiouridine(34) synthase MnmA [Kiritimatiellales bacterium]|nr:tRNA 2-thiouridine(34) synthase MnmA [Kiritimatiellales bacterium]
MKVLLAMSGGIDSSVIAYLLKEQGHDLVGVRFALWSDPLAPAEAQLLSNKCCDAQTGARAKYIADDLDFPLHNIDLSETFKREVVDYYLDGCKQGVTPNPCIQCNKHIRFKALLDLMDDFECEKLATGHYARIEKESKTDRYKLLEGIDQTKEQSYFLYGLAQDELARTIFPLGSMLKEDVYELAKKYNIPLDEKTYRESQNLCFFPEKTPKEFLKRYLSKTMKTGKIVKRDGTVIGEHKGLPLYTIGQRRIGVGGLSETLEVVDKNPESNELIVAQAEGEKLNKIVVQDLHWISQAPPENEEIPFDARTRSLSKKEGGKFKYKGNTGTFVFKEPRDPLSPGQSLVLYKGEEVIGGGIMA